MIDDRRFYLRHPALIVVGTPTGYLLVRGDDAGFAFPTVGDAGWSSLWQTLIQPTSGRTLRQLVAAASAQARQAVETMIEQEFLESSLDRQALEARRDRVFTHNQGFSLAPATPICDSLVFACTGSIVAALMPAVILSLAYSGLQHRLDVILTRAAQRFVARDLFEAYGIRTWVDAFERRDGIDVPHVSLGEAAGCILVMPATASALHRLASASCSDLLSLTVTASEACLVVSPVMNAAMWNHPGVQRNVRQLRADGAYVIEPTLIIGATALVTRGPPMYGGPGTLWAGPGALMQVLRAILQHAGGRGTSTP